MNVLDADGHIFEPEEMFDELDERFHARRPVLVTLPMDTPVADSNRVWIIEGKTVPTTRGRGRTFQAPLPGSSASATGRVNPGDATLQDVPGRIEGMGRFGIDQQVIYPTMFLQHSVDDVLLEGAILAAYNDYMGAACAKSGGRLKWNACIPWRNPEAAVAELRRASDLGCSGIFTMGVIFDQQLNDPLFFPIYEAASELDLPVCVHLGWGAPAVNQLFSENTFFCSGTVPVVWGFVSIMASGLLARFPKLRVGFIETGAGWVPYTIHKVNRQSEPPTVLRDTKSGRPSGPGIDRNYFRDPLEWFKEGRAFVTAEPDEDVPYLIQQLGEDSIMFSSDYPHGDQSADERFVSLLQARQDIPDRVKAKLLGENAARFYRV